MNRTARLQIAKAAALAKNLIHDPKDESGRMEGPTQGDKASTVAKAGYQNPPDELDPELDRGTCTNPATGSVANSGANEELRVHREHAITVYEEVYKQSRLAGYSVGVAKSDAEAAKYAVDDEYRGRLIRDIAVAKSQLSKIRGGIV